MKRTDLTLEKIKEEIDNLKGKYITMKVNEGRKRYINLKGVLEDTYKSVFVVRIESPKSVDLKSYSYIDVLCGNVDIANTSFSKIKEKTNLTHEL